MGKVSNFIKEVTARFKGDEAGVISAKNERKAVSAVNGQLAALKAKLVDDESSVEDAQEALKEAKYPITLISNNNTYVQGIKYAQDSLDNKQQTLDDTKSSIEYYEALLKEFNQEVEG